MLNLAPHPNPHGLCGMSLYHHGKVYDWNVWLALLFTCGKIVTIFSLLKSQYCSPSWSFTDVLFCVPMFHFHIWNLLSSFRPMIWFNSGFLKDFFIFILCVLGVLPALCKIHHVYTWYLRWLEDGVRSPGTGVTGYKAALWILGTKFKSSAKAAHACNHWAIWPAPQ